MSKSPRQFQQQGQVGVSGLPPVDQHLGANSGQTSPATGANLNASAATGSGSGRNPGC